MADQVSNEYSLRNYSGLKKSVVDSYQLERECLALGLATERLGSKLLRGLTEAMFPAVSYRDRTSQWNSEVARIVANRKHYAKEFLEGAGIRVADGKHFGVGEVEAAHAFARSLGTRVVVKPASGSLGAGVATDVDTGATFPESFRHAAEARWGSAGVLVEEFVSGRDFRAAVVGGRVVSLVERVPAYVVGDGVSTIVELVDRKNVSRRKNPYLGRRLLRIDATARRLLAQRGKDADDVPAAKERVQLSDAANLTQGGEGRELLDEAHPAVLDLIVDARRAIPGLSHAGVDLLLHDHGLPPEQQVYAVIEVNTNAEFSLHHFPQVGPARNVARAIVRWDMRAAGLDPKLPVRNLTAESLVQCSSLRSEYRDWIYKEASRLAISADVEIDAAGRAFRVRSSGPTGAVAALSASLKSRRLGTFPVRVLTKPLEGSRS